jgi:hypothetical protein
MVFDPADNATLLFGGCGSYLPVFTTHMCVALSDTWELHGGVWTNLTATLSGPSPPGRADAAMVWDAADGYVLMFGGFNGSTYYNDTWAFQGGAWHSVVTTHAPSPRFAPGMAYDAASQYVVLFGGASINATLPGIPTFSYNDTWTYHAGTWTNITNAIAPAPRFSMGMDYNPGDREVVMFGGWSVAQPSSFGDTWTFANGNWTEQATANGPPARNYLSMAYDAAINASVLTQGHVVFTTFNDLWTYNATDGWKSWMTAATPSGRWAASMAYDNVTGALWLFGGYTPNSTYLGDTWTLPLSTPSNISVASFDFNWVQLGSNSSSWPGPSYWTAVSSVNAPSPRASFGMVYDPAISQVVVFGGCTSGHDWNASCNATNETWTYSGGAWTQLHPTTSPSARVNPQMVYDAAAGYVLLFGGTSGTPYYLTYSDTWEFNGTDWLPISSTLHPTGGAWAAMAYDPATSAVILYDSGELYATGTLTNNTWEFSGGQWTELQVGTGPSPRSGAMLAWDNATQTIVMFGGFTCDNQGNCYNHADTWSFANGTWWNDTSRTAPPARNGGDLSYDPLIAETVLFGGHAATTFYNDAWGFTGGSWASFPSPIGPSPRYGAGFVYDTADQQMLLFGGYLNLYGPQGGVETFYNDTWAFGYATQNTTPRIVSLEVTPTTAHVGQLAMFVANVVSKSPLTFAYTNLPAGCTSADTDVLPCTPTEAGEFHLGLTVTDVHGQSTSLTVVFNVVPAVSPGGPAGGSTPGAVWSVLDSSVGAAVGALCVASAAVALRWRAKRDRGEGEALAKALESSSETERRSRP